MKKTENLEKRLDEYIDLNKGKVRKSQVMELAQKSILTMTLPFISVGAAMGQCQGSLGMNLIVDDTGGPVDVDVNGDAVNDLRFLENPNGNLKVQKLGAISIVRTAAYGPSSASAFNFSANASIPGGLPAGNLLYLDYPGGGQWSVTGVGTSATGFMGLKNGTDYGFLELTVTFLAGGGGGSQYSIDISEAGIGTPGVGSVTAGECLSLPAELTLFRAKVERGKVDLIWQTASETNNAGFEVQRSEDGENFRSLAFVEGNGNSHEKNDYSYHDKELRAGQTYYYRLKQIDFDGHFEYSKILQVKTKGTQSVAGEFMPNPIEAGWASIDFEAKEAGEWTASVFGPSGQLIHSAQLFIDEGQSRQQLDLSGLASGLYFVKFENGAERIYRKVSIK